MPHPPDLCHSQRNGGELKGVRREKLSPPWWGRRQGRVLYPGQGCSESSQSVPKESVSRAKNLFQGIVVVDRSFHMQRKRANIYGPHVLISLEMFSFQEPEELSHGLNQPSLHIFHLLSPSLSSSPFSISLFPFFPSPLTLSRPSLFPQPQLPP